MSPSICSEEEGVRGRISERGSEMNREDRRAAEELDSRVLWPHTEPWALEADGSCIRWSRNQTEGKIT